MLSPSAVSSGGQPTLSPMQQHEAPRRCPHAEQFLLVTLIVKLAVAAVLATMLVRFRWFRRILLTERRDWPERLIFAAGLGMPLVGRRRLRACCSTTTRPT